MTPHEERTAATLAEIARHYAERLTAGTVGLGELLAAAALLDRFGSAHDPSRPAAAVLRDVADELDGGPGRFGVVLRDVADELGGGPGRFGVTPDGRLVADLALGGEPDPRDEAEPRSVLDHAGYAEELAAYEPDEEGRSGL